MLWFRDEVAGGALATAAPSVSGICLCASCVFACLLARAPPRSDVYAALVGVEQCVPSASAVDGGGALRYSSLESPCIQQEACRRPLTLRVQRHMFSVGGGGVVQEAVTNFLNKAF